MINLHRNSTDALSSEALQSEINVEKLLANNPGNFVRKKVQTVDFTEVESLRRQLEVKYGDRLQYLSKSQER